MLVVAPGSVSMTIGTDAEPAAVPPVRPRSVVSRADRDVCDARGPYRPRGARLGKRRADAEDDSAHRDQAGNRSEPLAAHREPEIPAHCAGADAGEDGGVGMLVRT
jgi:hypothetical protein